MTALPASIADLAARFEWTRDRRDTWRVLRGPGPLRGDCDDFAVTALWIEAGSPLKAWWWLLTFQAWFWFTTNDHGQSHMMLWLRGRGWIDNAHPAWGPRQFRKRFPVLWPAVAIKMALR